MPVWTESGRTETLENIFGIATRKDGVIKLDGKVVKNRNARESIKNGFALLTEERRATGIFGILSIRENTVISSLKKHKKAGLYLSEKSMEKRYPVVHRRNADQDADTGDQDPFTVRW